jgi:hypothetical protein
MFNTPKNGFRTGMRASVFLLLLIFVGILLVGITSYDGHCISFEPPQRECNIFEFLFPYVLIFIVFSVISKPMLFLIILITLIALPIVGYMIGKKNIVSNSNA